MKQNNYIWLFIIIIIYTIIAFLNLGDTIAPQSFWKAKQVGQEVVIDIGEQEQVSHIMHYCGSAPGLYEVYMSVNGEAWTYVGEIDQKSVFKWSRFDVNKSTRYLLISNKTEGAELGEIGLYNLENQHLSISETTYKSEIIESNPKGLTDEPYTVPYGTSYKNSTYFDEVYHARTAYEHIHNIVPYEWTHPPLGKLIIGIGIRMFGMTPFGWRVMGTIAGIIMIPLMYAFGKLLFKKERYGLFAALLMACDGMHFTQTRIATVDSYLVLFILLSYFHMYKYCNTKSYSPRFTKLTSLSLSGLWISCAIATKWTGLYAGLGLAIIFFWDLYKRKNLDKDINVILINCIIFFVLLPVIVYIASYIPYFTAHNSQMNNIADFINMQKQMYNYHSKLDATHPYGSSWWSWPILYRPVWFYMGEGLTQKNISSILLLGNPLIWWGGTFAIIYGIYTLIIKKEREIIFLMIATATAYAPYIGISRIMFLYHFFPVLPFMIFLIVYILKEIESKKPTKPYIPIYIFMVICVFIAFYPIYSGTEIPRIYARLLRWLPSWNFYM